MEAWVPLQTVVLCIWTGWVYIGLPALESCSDDWDCEPEKWKDCLWSWLPTSQHVCLLPEEGLCRFQGVWARAAQEKAPFHWKCWDCRWSSHLKPEVKCCISLGFPGGSDDKESGFNVGDLGSISGLRTSLGKGNGYPLQYSCLENPMDRGNWQAIVHGVAKCKRGQTGLSD